MPILNRYFIIDNDDPNKDDITNLYICEHQSVRYSNDWSQFVIKLKYHDNNTYPILSWYEEYDQLWILTMMEESWWILDPLE